MFHIDNVNMPLFTICAYPGCHSPVPRGERYCDLHKEAGARRDVVFAAEAKKRRDERRRQNKGTTTQRGYGARWQALRKRYISQLGWGAKFGPEGSSIIGSPSGNPE